MGPLFKTLIGGVSVVVFTYVLIAYAPNFRTEARSATQAYADFAKTARGE